MLELILATSAVLWNFPEYISLRIS